ncbi:MAG: TrkH family potassium uptake protein [Pseudomonadota bacterium]
MSSPIQRILGILLTFFSLTLLPPLGLALYDADGTATAFATAFSLTLSAGLISWLPVLRPRRDMQLRDGFIVVAMFWLVLTAIGALPFILAHEPHLSVIDALFESVSGLTTTGATVITGLDDLPRAILYYRQQLQWLGGMGIIVLAVAVLPLLGIGGMQLYRAETPGPMKDAKLTPRITETAKALWLIYLGLTLICAIAYWAAGMSPFDALGHAYSTIAIGGFSTHDASLGYFNSQAVQAVAIVFMLIAAINFALHFVALRRRNLRIYWQDAECRLYISLLSLVVFGTILGLLLTNTDADWQDNVSQGLFQAVSIATTAGFTTADWYQWPAFITILLLFSSFIGGCAGSTGGGMKVIRILLLFKQGAREIMRLIHPNAQLPLRIGDKVISSRIVGAVWGFFALYVASFSLIYLSLAATGLDLITAFSATAASINNLGPGLGQVGAHYADLPDISKGILCFAMLLGRLEIFTLLVLLSPAFWRR